MARENPALKTAALAGELPLLPWRGGVDRALKKKTKLGAMYYLAMWQGLRGEDLDVDTEREVILTCSRYGVTVRFTWHLLEELRGQESEEGVDA